MAQFGGMGGITEGRNLNSEDLFEMTLNRLFGERMKLDDEFCTKIWSALANVDWEHKDGHTAAYSFRAAGDLISAIRGSGNYMDWYCSGPDSTVSEEIEYALFTQGWTFVI